MKSKLKPAKLKPGILLKHGEGNSCVHSVVNMDCETIGEEEIVPGTIGLLMETVGCGNLMYYQVLIGDRMFSIYYRFMEAA